MWASFWRTSFRFCSVLVREFAVAVTWSGENDVLSTYLPGGTIFPFPLLSDTVIATVVVVLCCSSCSGASEVAALEEAEPEVAALEVAGPEEI